MARELFEDVVVIQTDGEYIMQDLDARKRFYQAEGWDFVGTFVVDDSKPNVKEVVMRYSREKGK